jgi:phage shock protein C
MSDDQRRREAASEDSERLRGDPRSADFQASVARLERAVQEVVVTARERFSDRATTFIDDTTTRLEQELGRRSRRPDPGPGSRRMDPEDEVPRKLYRDRQRQKIGGVCAGIARYYGVEPWVVRLIVVTGLLFFPSIVFPAYWIAYFVMSKGPKDERAGRRQDGRHGRGDHRSPAPELGSRLAPRYSLRNVQADLTEVELRLRRMETHVTSGQYELQRELNKIDSGASGGRI